MVPEGSPGLEMEFEDDGGYATMYVWTDPEGDTQVNLHIHHAEHGEARISARELRRVIAALSIAASFVEAKCG